VFCVTVLQIVIELESFFINIIMLMKQSAFSLSQKRDRIARSDVFLLTAYVSVNLR